MPKKTDRSYLVVVRRAPKTQIIQQGAMTSSWGHPGLGPEIRWIDAADAKAAARQAELDKGDNALVIDREHVTMFRPPRATELEVVEGTELR